MQAAIEAVKAAEKAMAEATEESRRPTASTRHISTGENMGTRARRPSLK